MLGFNVIGLNISFKRNVNNEEILEGGVIVMLDYSEELKTVVFTALTKSGEEVKLVYSDIEKFVKES